MHNMRAIPFMSQYQQKPYPKGNGGRRYGTWSSLRKGIPWKVGEPEPIWAFANIAEERILDHTVFGIGEHPWPDDMRLNPCGAEHVLIKGTDEQRYDFIQLMTLNSVLLTVLNQVEKYFQTLHRIGLSLNLPMVIEAKFITRI